MLQQYLKNNSTPQYPDTENTCTNKIFKPEEVIERKRSIIFVIFKIILLITTLLFFSPMKFNYLH